MDKINNPTASAITNPYPAISPDIPPSSLILFFTDIIAYKIINPPKMSPLIPNKYTSPINASIKKDKITTISTLPVSVLK